MSTPTPETIPETTPKTTPRRSLLAPLAFQPSRPHLLIGLLFLLLGLLVTVAIVRPGEEPAWQNARAEDLVQILDDLDARQDRLEAEAVRLAGVQAELEAGSTADAVAEARRRLEALQVLTGTTAVTGPGIAITLSDPEGAIDGPVLIDAVQELRDAGAEAIQVGPVRVVVDTWFADDPDGGVVVNGEPLTSPIRITAIGDPDTMLAALAIPGGLADSVRTRGAEFAASAVPDLTISVTVPASGP